MTFVSYAQNFEDVMLWRALQSIPAGFYIDVGASHPDADSVTRAFYDRGWHGINVEPTAATYQRLVAARPRDVNLRLALGPVAGTASFYSVDDVNTGLSTLDAAAVARYRDMGMGVQQTQVQTQTLAEVCRVHAPAEIHFLKIDVEGAERAVLESADFAAFRPWITLVEATAPMSTIETHAEWEPILLAADYRFAWFDGLNRFYIAAERFDALSPSFRTPPNIFDGFLRASDTDWTRRIVDAEARADVLATRSNQVEQRAAVAEDRAEAAHLRLARASTEAARARAADDSQAAEIARLETAAAALRQLLDEREAALDRATAAVRELDGQRLEAASLLESMRRSTSWRVTAPLRRLRAATRTEPHRPVPPKPPPTPAPRPAPPPAPFVADRNRVPPRAVHQAHAGFALGDIGAMLHLRAILRRLGYDSRIFAEQPGAAQGEVHPLDDLPEGDGYVLIVHDRCAYAVIDQILSRPVRKILFHHGAALPDGGAQEQLRLLRPAVDAALADSEAAALDLRRLGFPAVAACSLLFDLEAVLVEERVHAPTSRFTILSVGPLAPGHGHLAIIAGFVEFRRRYPAASRLVLIGPHEPGAALQAVLELIQRHGLGHGAVEITGVVPPEELRRRYAEADLYVSASEHEGFPAPLVEAVARGVPVLAVAAAGAAYTLTDPAGPATGLEAGLLPDDVPATMAAAMLDLAQDGPARQALACRQSVAIRRFGSNQQVPALVEALARAGAAAPIDAATHAALAGNAGFTVVGHVNGSGGPAAITRDLALALEAARPGAVRLVPVEGDVITYVSDLPQEHRAGISRLLARPAPLGAPHVVISHHYPVWVPPEPCDVALAVFSREESPVPADTVAVLNRSFRGVLATSPAAAKALLDAGIKVPVRVIRLSPGPQTGANAAAGIAGFAADLLLFPPPPSPNAGWVTPRGEPGVIDALASAILRRDPRCVVIELHADRLPWRSLPDLLNRPALHGRVVCAVLRDMTGLADAPPEVIAALGRLSRVVVHTDGAMDMLARLGLVLNTLLIPPDADQQDADAHADSGDGVGAREWARVGRRWQGLLTALSVSGVVIKPR